MLDLKTLLVMVHLENLVVHLNLSHSIHLRKIYYSHLLVKGLVRNILNPMLDQEELKILQRLKQRRQYLIMLDLVPLTFIQENQRYISYHNLETLLLITIVYRMRILTLVILNSTISIIKQIPTSVLYNLSG